MRELSFVSHRTADGLGQIFRLDVEHPSKVTRVTRGNGWATSPTWSPDGTRVAYAEIDPKALNSTQGSTVYLAHADGTRPVSIIRNAGDPVWSPEGQSIAVAKLGPKRGIGIIAVDEALASQRSAYRQVTTVDISVPEEWVDWSPDGKRLVFTSQRSGDSDIWVVDVNGSNLRNVTNNPNALDGGPSWSPDGRTIVFDSTRDSASQVPGEEMADIYAIDLDSGSITRLTRAPGGSNAPAWSPDGKLIAFNALRDGNSEVYVMNADGSDQRRITHEREPDGIVAWIGRGCSS